MRSTEHKAVIRDPESRPVIPVSAGCLINSRGEVLIAQRPVGKIAAGKWEFPGGKIHDGESPQAALERELREELGIVVRQARRLIRVCHEYPDRTVILEVWRVTAFVGEPHPHEGQALAWVRPDELARWDLLEADQPIMTALRLPADYVFTSPDADETRISEGLARLPVGALLRLRLPRLDDRGYARLAERLLPACQSHGLLLVLDRDPGQAAALGAVGWHASATRLRMLTTRPVSESLWFAASCHSVEELVHAEAVGADFAVLGSLQPTASHPGEPGLGWHTFEEWVNPIKLPVYAIGGLGSEDCTTAWEHGAQGIAGISAYWGAYWRGSSSGGSTGA